MGLDIKRLQILMRIAQEYHLSFDELDNWTCQLDWQEFQDWSEIFPRSNGQRGRDFPILLQEETVQPFGEFANDNPEWAKKYEE